MDGDEPLSAELAMVAENLERWPKAAGGTPTLINLSENHTFRIDDAAGGQTVLRLHRPGYQSRAAIASELGWLGALKRDTAIPLPRPLPAKDGALLQEVASNRFAVLFAFEPGREPQPEDDLTGLFHTLGIYAATAHNQVMHWPLPTGFSRPTWDADTMLDANGLWGNWRKAPAVEGAVLQMLESLDRRLRADLDAYGKGPDRFGLIHADMRLANLLVDGEKVTLIDFDDCGFGWFVYDLAASLSFIETSAAVPQLLRSWLAGYLQVRPLSAEDIKIIDAMILLRRIVLLAWIGTHAETDLAKAHAENFAVDTARLAERYLG